MNAQDKLKIIDEKIIALLHEIDREKGISKTMYYDTLLNVYLKKKKQFEKELEK